MSYYKYPNTFEVITETDKFELKAYDFEYKVAVATFYEFDGCVQASFWTNVGGRGPSFKMVSGVKEINKIKSGKLYVPNRSCYSYDY